MRNQQHVVFIPTNTPGDANPRDVSDRALARLTIGAAIANSLRSDEGRANVLVVLFGGWTLYQRLPLAIHHAYAAIDSWELFKPEDLDLVVSHGFNSVGALLPTMDWLNRHYGSGLIAHVVTSEGHARRLIAESNMRSRFAEVHHVESSEPREATEDANWTDRSLAVPQHQFSVSGRAGDVEKFGAKDAFGWSDKMQKWAEANPEVYAEYRTSLWSFIGDLEAANVAVCTDAPGNMRLRINY